MKLIKTPYGYEQIDYNNWIDKKVEEVEE